MTAKQWGHGFHKGRSEGEEWGVLIESGRWEKELQDISLKLTLAANALRLPCNYKSGRTDVWWQIYANSVAKQIDEIVKGLPSMLNSVHEFDSEIPKNIE